ncbi:ABC transporter permease [Methanobrevibacter olleyae]|uniref:Peptide/nickel ABC transporter permease protein n=2 Tax=Methanobrevibacter olleyae TaxID=294671 RepID=A0A126R0R7_METOL|nr:peptide/nickel ABC transporter permease protein [Methanobrevibacter olleyae]SFL23807.1 peptide/nickel transport system permease protein [Methanobrevibacter olleyae]
MMFKRKVDDNKPWFVYNANLRTKTLVIIGVSSLFLLAILISSMLIDTSALSTDFSQFNQFPSFEHIFGTDWMGRDMFTRTVAGLGLSMGVGAFASIISTAVAIILGLFSGVNRLLDEFVAGVIDLFSAIPHILLIILLSISVGGGFYGVIIGVGLTHWTPLARILRAEVKQIQTTEFIKMAEQQGKSKLWIATKHMFPLVVSQIIVGVILMFPHAIMHEAGITFLGFGLSPHEPAIGIILAESMQYLSNGAWWLAFFPGLSLLIIVLLFDLIGEYVHMLLDPVEAQK